MATISNPTDPNKTVATSNVAPQPASTSGTQTPTGQYSTLQKYLSANQGSGQRLAGAIGTNVNKEVSGLKDATGREISESEAANQNIGNLTGTTSDFTNKLKSANTVQPPTPTGKAYGVEGYATNLSGAQAAADISKNQDQLNTFRGIASGDTSSKLKEESNKQANEAMAASAKAYDTNKERQSQLNNFNDRSMLLQKAINSRNQRAGLQNLDNALLSQDKSGTLNQVNQNLQANTKGLQENKNVATAKQADVGTLSTAQAAAELGLNNRLGEMTAEQQNALTERVKQINDAKVKRNTDLESKFAKFKETGEMDEDLAEVLQMQNVMDVDAEARRRLGLPDASAKMTPAGSNIRLFNAMNNVNSAADAVDLGLLNTMAASGKDVANQADVDYYQVLNTLSGGTLQNPLSVSKFTGSQVGEASLDDEINRQANEFLDKMQNKKSAMALGDAKSGGGDWYGGGAVAEASIGDYLYKKQLKKALRTESDPGSGISTGLPRVEEYTPDQLSLLQDMINRGGAENFGYNTGILNTGFDDRSAYNYNQGSSGEAAAKAEDLAVGNIKSRIEQELANMGYANLAKRIQGR